MQVQIHITSEKMQHAKPSQFGAIVAHVMKSKCFHRATIHKTYIEIMFNVGDGAAFHQSIASGPELEKEVIALLDLDPMPCPCGCGQFLAIGPCFEQSGELNRRIDDLNKEEKDLICSGQIIAAIKAVRDRAGRNSQGLPNMSLKDAKDLCDNYSKTIRF